MKDFKLIKWIKRFIIIALMFTLYDTTMNVLDEVYLRLVNEQAFIDEAIDVDSFLTMQELGYEYSEVTDAQVKTNVGFTLDPSALTFKFSINNDDVNNTTNLYFTFYQFKDENVANEVYKVLVSSTLNNYNSILANLNNDLKKPNDSYDTAIQKMVKLDNTSWNSDLAYALDNPFETTYTPILLIKDNKVLDLTYSSSSTLTQDQVIVLGKLMDKVDVIFDTYGKE